MAKKNFLKLPTWLRFNVFYRADLTADDSDDIAKEESQREVVHPYDANLISSEGSDGTHMLLLDLDINHFYIDSTSNSHLMLDTKLSLDALKEVVDTLVKHGILQQGIKKQLDRDGHLSLRMPGMIKDSVDDYDLEKAKTVPAEKIDKAAPITKLEKNPSSSSHGLFQSLVDQYQPYKPYSPQVAVDTFMGYPVQWVEFNPTQDIFTIAVVKYGKIEEMQCSGEIFDAEQYQMLQQMAMKPKAITFAVDGMSKMKESFQEIYNQWKEIKDEQD